MKKVLFCAAFIAAMSMAFVACGKKENKAAEGEKTECCADAKEQLVLKIEQACSANDMEALQALQPEMEKYSQEDFTEEQQERILKAVSSLLPADNYGVEDEEEDFE